MENDQRKKWKKKKKKMGETHEISWRKSEITKEKLG